ncbi:MAG TPA: lysophospholipid acyltransferase family protein [Quisquiliibacterium sp.]|nr:lysophospholipid acyltransferase family protein [Quisquiliibacterium sp.]
MLFAAARRALRLPLVVALLFGGLFTVTVLFPFGREPFRRAAIRHWSRMLLWCCGLRLRELPAPQARSLTELPRGRMLVANHISWVDIFAINALCPASFVAKAEIARWPLVGTLVARTGTLFIERGKRRAVHRMIEHIGRNLQAGGRVAVFPEGTTGDGRCLMPFHANLVQAAVEARIDVVPLGVRYVDTRGDRAQAIEYIGDTSFVESMWRILGARGLCCEVHPLAPIPGSEGLSRHDVAERARAAIAARLGLPLEDALPDRIRALRGG